MINIVVSNILWMIVAYLIGSINFSILLTKYNPNMKNIKEVGSGNAGATNASRVYGLKFGLIIFILDASKSFWYGIALGLMQKNIPAFSNIIPQLCLIFVIIGHIFPIYFGFKGGKGAATLLGMISAISIFLAIIGTIIFLSIVIYTKYVSLGSIVTPLILSAFAFLCPFWNNLDSVIHYGPFWLSPLCLLISWILVTTMHWQNIIKLIHKTESKFEIKKIKKIDKKNDDEKNKIWEMNNIDNIDTINIHTDYKQNIDSIIDKAIDINDKYSN